MDEFQFLIGNVLAAYEVILDDGPLYMFQFLIGNVLARQKYWRRLRM